MEKVAADLSTYYFNSGDVTDASKIDGIHLDQEQHEILGAALAKVVCEKGVF